MYGFPYMFRSSQHVGPLQGHAPCQTQPLFARCWASAGGLKLMCGSGSVTTSPLAYNCTQRHTGPHTPWWPGPYGFPFRKYCCVPFVKSSSHPRRSPSLTAPGGCFCPAHGFVWVQKTMDVRPEVCMVCMDLVAVTSVPALHTPVITWPAALRVRMISHLCTPVCSGCPNIATFQPFSVLARFLQLLRRTCR